jgi:hypothetical protein
LVDPDAVLPCPVPGERFQPVAGKLGQVAQPGSSFQHPQPLFSLLSERLQLWNSFPISEALRFFVLIASDHLSVYQKSTLDVQRKDKGDLLIWSRVKFGSLHNLIPAPTTALFQSEVLIFIEIFVHLTFFIEIGIISRLSPQKICGDFFCPLFLSLLFHWTTIAFADARLWGLRYF